MDDKKTAINETAENNKNPELKIFSSRNIITPGEKVYFIADVYSSDGSTKAVIPQWVIEPPLKGVRIDKFGVLLIVNPLQLGKEGYINVKAVYKDHIARKKIKIVRNDPLRNKNRVHFFRYNGEYHGWNVWTWKQADGKQVDFIEKTDFGMLAASDQDNIIIRQSTTENLWHSKATTDINLKSMKEIFIVEGDHRVYTDFRDAFNATKPRLLAAIMDTRDSVYAHLSSPPLAGTEFYLYKNEKQIASSRAKGRDLQIQIPRTIEFDPSALYEIRSNSNFLPKKVTLRRVLDDFYYSGDDLGATYTKDKINIRIWSPTASKVELLTFYEYNQPLKEGKVYKLERDMKTGTWHGSLSRNLLYDKFYLYRITFNENTHHELITHTVGPYAKAVTVNGTKACFLDTENDRRAFPYNWRGDYRPPLAAFEDSIIYELHVQDFSIDRNSGVNKNYKGKYMAFTQSGTCHPSDSSVKTCLDHLEELGITHVHLLPVYDFSSVDEASKILEYNWGYDPKNYNVPEGSYSTDPINPVTRIREFRSMVQSLHDKQIRVVMDVVYNHTHKTLAFDEVVPGYYYRTDYWGRYTNGSGCGNEVATERPMVRKFILDSLKYWAKAYNIDGFRFDLMGLIDIETMHQVTHSLRQIEPTLLIYGEPWTAGGSSLPGHMQTAKNNIRELFKHGTELAVFNDDFRNAIRGDNGIPYPSRAFVTGNVGNADRINRGVLGSSYSLSGDSHDTIIAIDPAQTINYASAHDNYVLWDQVISALGFDFPYPYLPQRKDDLVAGAELDDFRVRRALLANAIVLTSQGIPFIHAGSEMLRTKFGDHNSYKSGERINRIRWDWKKDHKVVFQLYKQLIALRKSNPVFRMRTREDIFKYGELLPVPGCVSAVRLKKPKDKPQAREAIVIYNPYLDPQIIGLPEGRWKIKFDSSENPEKIVDSLKFEEFITVEPLSAVVLQK
ncbi:MAG: type I pullulanase [Vulcanimicrobiota bacterium]